MRFEPDIHAPSNRAGFIDSLVPSVYAQRAVVTQRNASCVPMGVEFETPLVFRLMGRRR